MADESLRLLRRLVQYVQDDNLKQQLKTSLSSLSKKEISALKKVLTVKSAKGDSAGKTINKVTDITKLQLAPSLERSLPLWRRDNTSYFLETTAESCSYETAGAVFNKLQQNKENKDTQTIKRRFDLRSLYKFAVSRHYHSGKRWREGGSRSLASDICKDVPNNDVDAVEKELQHLIHLGRGFEAWVKQLGGPGYLLLLPLEICETKYVIMLQGISTFALLNIQRYAKRHNRNGITKDADHLKKIGIQAIAEEQGVLPLGRYIADQTLKHAKEQPQMGNKLDESNQTFSVRCVGSDVRNQGVSLSSASQPSPAWNQRKRRRRNAPSISQASGLPSQTAGPGCCNTNPAVILPEEVSTRHGMESQDDPGAESPQQPPRDAHSLGDETSCPSVVPTPYTNGPGDDGYQGFPQSLLDESGTDVSEGQTATHTNEIYPANNNAMQINTMDAADEFNFDDLPNPLTPPTFGGPESNRQRFSNHGLPDDIWQNIPDTSFNFIAGYDWNNLPNPLNTAAGCESLPFNWDDLPNPLDNDII
ncbi:hypothetical protein McanCB21832_002336 [Microsporum canis]